ncbi:helicase-exonuclease AddAB subunit AddB [Mesobacillus subterraneus]|uniref:ATP-dependent helicase/deoxyribonuclease subunit B n=1 Tax=Mesobacillus subterraneus TaxID=285983 RepID=A0A3R9F5B5_9BACI|nr:helicase-exonuclease AddAB subunit AddB [Mesobacillus subterraneus]RSD29326.1 helicase-exonuclease AddAB subunit AddB [Mesobacillus subterraneus]
MSVRLVLGRSGSGKTEMIINEIKDRLIEDPQGDPVVYLVPEQMSFLSEYRLSTDPDLGGMIRAQVYSFPRLAWRILQETGGYTRHHLDSVGISMMIRKIIEDKKEDLKIFQKAADKNGFIQQMEQMLIEFKRYAINPDELAGKMEDGSGGNKALKDKIHDLELVYRQFEDELFGKYIDSEDYFRLLAEKVPASQYLKNAEIYIDGFYSFTPLEMMIIDQLIATCRRVTIAIPADRNYAGEQPDELNLFRVTADTCSTLNDLIKTRGYDQEEDVVLTEQRRWQDESLRHLENEFDSRPAVKYIGESSIHIAQAANRRAELEGVARKILGLARNHGYRYRDMAVLMRGSDYREVLETIFDDYGLPYFIDQKRNMLHHPLIELVRSSLETVLGNWRYEPIFRAVKTDLLFPEGSNLNKMREQMDVLENYVLAYGIQGDKWTKKDRWKYKRIRGLEFDGLAQTDAEKQMEQELNDLRHLITSPLQRLARRLKRADTGRKLSEAVYLFIEELDIPAKLEAWRMAAEQEGRLVEAREHEQAWDGVINLLDQFVEMLGESKVAPKQFVSILDAGFESLRFSLVPPAIDQVLVADLEKTRLADVKVAFVIGVNEGVLPAKMNEEGIFADDDRELLQSKGIKLAPGSRTKLLDENFIAYKAFVTPSEKLFISYPIANEEGKALMPSSFIKRIADLFPEHQTHVFLPDPSELPEQEQLEYAAGENVALSYLTSQLQLKKRNYPVYDFWWDVYDYYLNNHRWADTARMVLSSLFYENRTKQLSEAVTKELYGEQIEASVSRMELFNSCPFSHYVQHGLKLRDRQIFRLEAPDIGDLFHAALKEIAETVMQQNLSWAQLTRAQAEELARNAVQKLAPRLQNEILLSSNRHHYIRQKLQNIISRASLVLSEHAKVSGFSPVGLELGFGRQGQLPPLAFSLKNGTRMELMGRIDRVDKAEDDHGVYLRVVDYKSSVKDVNLTEVYYGVALQMLTYLDIIITHSPLLVGKPADPAGVLYFHVHNPIVNASKMLTLEEIEEEILKRFKMNGLLLNDENVIRLMDQGLDSGSSQIISAGFKKDGSLLKSSKVASKEDFDHLRQFVRNKYVETGNRIVSGIVDVAPYKLKDRAPCTFCSFKPVCQFDQGVESNDFRKLPVIKKEDLLEALRQDENLKAKDGLSVNSGRLEELKKMDLFTTIGEEEEDLG